VHIGSAFNKPIIAMYPNYKWNFVSWQPLSTKFKAIRSKTNFINSISVDEVADSFTELYKQLFI
jgi:ADP-heptose:LPS heptosyltransferase